MSDIYFSRSDTLVFFSPTHRGPCNRVESCCFLGAGRDPLVSHLDVVGGCVYDKLEAQPISHEF